MRALVVSLWVVCTVGACVPAVTPSAVANATGSDRSVEILPEQIVRGEHAAGGDSRAWRLFVPRREAGQQRSMLVVLHGCTQDADDLARGTRSDDFARRDELLVLMPEQPLRAHPQKCWNWYAPAHQERDGGELALLAAMIDSVAAAHDVDPRRVHLAGLSAGAAMAQLLATAYPERFASLTMASGVAVGAARTVPDALSTMRSGPREGATSADVVLTRMSPNARAMPLLVLHGEQDAVVSPTNADAIVAQWRGALSALGVLLVQEQRFEAYAADARAVSVLRWRDSTGTLWLESRRMATLGHAWAGGDSSGTYVQPDAPDATQAMFAFIQRVSP